MKNFILLFILFLSDNLYAQKQDSINIVKEIDSLILLSDKLRIEHHYDQSLLVVQNSLRIAKLNFKDTSSVVMKCYGFLAAIYNTMGNFVEAKPLLIKMVEYRVINPGKSTTQYGGALSNLAYLYNQMGKIDTAKILFLEALAIVRNASGRNHKFYSNILYNLGKLYTINGEYENAESHFNERLELLKINYGNKSVNYAEALQNLGVFYTFTSNFVKAEIYLNEASNIFLDIQGDTSINYIKALSGYAGLKSLIGQYDIALTLNNRAVSLYTKTFGKDYLYTFLNSRTSSILTQLGRTNEAEASFMESYNICKHIRLDDNKIFFCDILGDLGAFYLGKREVSKADSFLSKACNCYDDLGNVSGHDHLVALLNLSELKEIKGDKSEALKICSQVLYNLKNSVQKYDLLLSETYFRLAKYYASNNDFIKSYEYWEYCFDIQKHLLINSVGFMSENELAKYVDQFNSKVSKFNSSIYWNINLPKLFNSLAYNNSLFYKGFLLESANQLNNQFNEIPDSLSELYLKWKSKKRMLAKSYSEQIGNLDQTNKMEYESDELEKKIILKLPVVSKLTQQYNWIDVQSKLHSNEVAIEFNLNIISIYSKIDSIYYSALILLPGDSFPHFIPLFEEKELNQLLSLSQLRKMDYVNGVYHTANDRGAFPIQENSKSLYDLIWKPLEPYLKGIKTIYFSPSGLLHRINQNAISVDEHTLLSDKYDLVQLGSTRQLVFKDQNENAKPISACIYGGINFDIDSTTIIDSFQKRDSTIIALRSELSFSYTD